MAANGMDQLQLRKDRYRNSRTPPPPPKHPKTVGAGGAPLGRIAGEERTPQTKTSSRVELARTGAACETVGLPAQGSGVSPPPASSASASPAATQPPSAFPLQTSTRAVVSTGRPATPEQWLPGFGDTCLASTLISACLETDLSSPYTRLAALSWLQARSAEEAASQLLDTAAESGPRERDAILELIAMHGADADQALRRHGGDPVLGPWVQAITGSAYDGKHQLQNTGIATWLQVEEIARVWQNRGANDAYTALWRRLGSASSQGFESLIATLLRTKHPQAETLEAELQRVHGTSEARCEPLLYRIRVGLNHSGPSVWRSVDVPADATLEDLHKVIQILMDWDGEELHVFQVGDQRYSGEFHNPPEYLPQHLVRIDAAFDHPPKQSILYLYGRWQRHEITVEEVIDAHSLNLSSPRCNDGEGMPIATDLTQKKEQGRERGVNLKAINARLQTMWR